MASPFRGFRKYQKAFLAVLCVVLMFAFVFMDMGCDPRSGNDSVVAETNFGDIHRSKLNQLKAARNIANGFIGQLIGAQAFFGSADDRSLINSYLMTQKAQELGMVVTDQAVLDFINDLSVYLGMDGMPKQRIQDALDKSNTSQGQLLAALRIELQAAWLYQQYFAPEFMESRTPAERWRFFERVHRQVQAQALAVPVSAFLDKVPEPTGAQLQEFFERYKNEDYNPDFPDPGFRQPQRTSFQYVVADYSAVLEAVTPTITDEEVKKYYEDNQQLFRWSGFQEVAPSDDPRGNSAPPMEDSAPPAATPPATTPPATMPPATTPPANNPPADNDPPPAKPEEGAQRAGKPRFFPVAFQANDGQETPATTPPATTPPALTPPAGATPAAEGAAPAAANEGDTAPVEAPVADPAATPETAAPEALPDRETLEELVRETLTIPNNILGGPNPQFEPLWKVEQNIRERLARERAAEWILNGKSRQMTGLREIRSQLAKLTSQWRDAYVRFAEDPKYLEEAREKLEKQAAQIATDAINSSFFKLEPPTGNLTLRELMDQTELGKSQLIPNSANAAPPRGGPGFADAFVRSTMFDPSLSQSTDVDQNVFLFWKVNERPEFVPKSLEEVKDQVITAWKMIEARKLAMSEAQALESKARDGNKPLTELSFANESGISLPPLTWLEQTMSQFGQRGGLQESQLPEEIKSPGLDLRKTLFNLENGEYGVSFNQPQTIVYVLHVTGSTSVMGGRQISEQNARRNFMAEPFRTYAQAAQLDYMELQREFLLELHQEYDVNIVQELSGRGF